MAQPKRKTSKMKKRQRKAANRYGGIQVGYCKKCDAPTLPHRVCPSCGYYGDKAVLEVAAAE
ncbi:MAG: 50S ribosomal protein L32 [Lentisphaerales bacterium]|nr:50S ribosomal protein L32 [Lentisphaerales bacterium]